MPVDDVDTLERAIIEVTQGHLLIKKHASYEQNALTRNSALISMSDS